jgi:hypothetical protein
MKKLLLFSLLVPKLITAQVPVLSPIQGASPICFSPSQVNTYSVTASNSPSTYSWMVNPATGVTIAGSSSSSPSISFPGPGTYTVYAAAINISGPSNPVFKVVQVFQAPSVTFSGVTKMCQGSQTFLMASPTMQSSSTTLSFTWSPVTGLSNPFSLTNTFNPSQTTTYTLSLLQGPCSGSTILTVTVNPTPTLVAVTNPTIICAGEKALVTLGGAVDPYMVNGNPMMSGSSITPTSTTNYTVTANSADGCPATTYFTQKVSACLGLKTTSPVNSMVVYPNPSLGNFILRSPHNETAIIYSETGQIIRSINLNKDTDTEITGLVPGLYYLVTPGTKMKLVVYR